MPAAAASLLLLPRLAGVLRTALGVCGAGTIREFQQAELVIAPAIKTEGKTITSA